MTIIYIIITLLILSILIIVHEYGHFLAARLTGVRVLEFSIGMGPALFKKETKETLYALRALPIGGYCRLQGEEGEEAEEEDDVVYDPDESFYNKPAWVKILILVAGVTMNFILAYVAILFASLLSGRDFLNAFITTNTTFVEMIGLIFTSLKMLFTGEAGLDDLAGPVGMVQMVGEIYQYGFILFLLFTAMLSINLAILNALPLPALDGGQILFVLVEKLKRGEISQKFKAGLMMTSYFLLIFLAIFVACNDIGRIFGA